MQTKPKSVAQRGLSRILGCFISVIFIHFCWLIKSQLVDYFGGS